MELYVPEEIVDSLIEISKSFNIDANIIDRIEKGDQIWVALGSEQKTLVYN